MWIANIRTMLVHYEGCEFASSIDFREEYIELYHALGSGFQEAGCCLTDSPYSDFAELHEQRASERRELTLAGCMVCGEKRCIERAHIRPRSIGGIDTMPLCPLHHKAFDEGLLTKREINRLASRINQRMGKAQGELVLKMHGAVAGLRGSFRSL